MRVLGIESWSSGRATSAPNHWTIPPSPWNNTNFKKKKKKKRLDLFIQTSPKSLTWVILLNESIASVSPSFLWLHVISFLWVLVCSGDRAHKHDILLVSIWGSLGSCSGAGVDRSVSASHSGCLFLGSTGWYSLNSIIVGKQPCIDTCMRLYSNKIYFTKPDCDLLTRGPSLLAPFLGFSYFHFYSSSTGLSLRCLCPCVPPSLPSLPPSLLSSLIGCHMACT